MSQAWLNLNTQLKAHNKSFKSLCKKTHRSDEQKAARRLTQR